MSSGSKITPVGDLTVCSAMCCSIAGFTFKYPDCFGFAVDGVMCCFKQNCACCKLMDERQNDDGKILICQEGGCFLVQPTTCMQQQNQCCCIDSRCALPCTEQVPMMCTCLPGCVIYPKFGCCAKVKDLKEIPEAMCPPEMQRKEKDLSDVPVGHVRVCEACCCSICGFIFKTPECLGCKQEGIMCCFQSECSGCKMIGEENAEKIFCICADGGAYLVMPSTCCSVTETFFCLDYRCAFPCTEKVPCICTCLPGLVLFADKQFKVACLPKVEDIIESCKVAPAQVVMT